MNVNLIFGENLKLLAGRSGQTIVKICDDLDISRVQFNRFVKGESFPKPFQLSRICNYFDVDARIFTETLSSLRASTTNASSKANSAIYHPPFDFIPANDSYRIDDSELANGLYLHWRLSMTEPDKVVASAIQVRSTETLKVFRGFLLPQLFIGSSRLPASRREFRGVIFNQNDGFSFMFFHQPPVPLMAQMYVSRNYEYGEDFRRGYIALARNDYAGKRRVSRCFLEKLPDGPKGVMQAVRKSRWYTHRDLPNRMAQELLKPLDTL